MERSKKHTTHSKTTKKASREPQLRRLATADMRHLPKPHVGFDAFTEPLLQMVEQFGEPAGKSSVDVAAIRASLASWRELAVMREAAAQQLAAIENTRFAEASSVWTQMLVIYAHAKIAARTNPDIRAALQAFENFMKKPSRDKSTPAPTAPTTPTTPAT